MPAITLPVGGEIEMTNKRPEPRLRSGMIVAVAAVAVAGCQSLPRMLSRPVAVQAGGIDCVGATLVELGYTIVDGDRATGFIRGERQRWKRGVFYYNRYRQTDILMVSETTSEGSIGTQLNVTASRWKRSARSVELNEDGTHRLTLKGGEQVGPSDTALADAEHLLGRCSGVSGEVP